MISAFYVEFVSWALMRLRMISGDAAIELHKIAHGALLAHIARRLVGALSQARVRTVTL